MTVAKSTRMSAVSERVAGSTPRSVKAWGSVSEPRGPPSQMYTRPMVWYRRSNRIDVRCPTSG